jgi:hypothetical protein
MSAEAPSSSLIVVRDRRGWRDRARSYELVLDGVRVAKIRRGQRIELPISPGRHKVFMRINWGMSWRHGRESQSSCSARLVARSRATVTSTSYTESLESRGGQGERTPGAEERRTREGDESSWVRPSDRCRGLAGEDQRQGGAPAATDGKWSQVMRVLCVAVDRCC